MADLIIPLYIQANPDTPASDDSAYEVVSSHVNLGSGIDLTLDDAAKVGTFVNFLCTNSTVDATVTFGTAAGGASNDKITFAATGDSAQCIYFPDGWRCVGLQGTASLG
jgi:hypothetical protein